MRWNAQVLTRVLQHSIKEPVDVRADGTVEVPDLYSTRGANKIQQR